MDCASYGPGPNAVVQSAQTVDGWCIECENPALDLYARLPNATAGGDSLNSLNVQKNTLGKMLLAQWMNNQDSKAFANNVMDFVAQIEGSDGGAGYNMRMTLLASNAGPNIVPRPMVTAWNAASVDPTFAAGITALPFPATSGLNPAVFASYIWSTGIGDKPTFDNLALAIWTDGQINPGALFQMTNAFGQRNTGVIALPNKPQQSVCKSMCELYVEKSYEPDVVPGTAVMGGAYSAVGGGAPTAVRYRNMKPWDPNVAGTNPLNGLTFFSPVTGNPGQGADITAGVDAAANIVDSSQEGFAVSFPGAPAGNVIRFHWLADAAL